jgi:hypothetical protein
VRPTRGRVGAVGQWWISSAALIDWQNVFCEVSTRIKQEFRQTRTPIDYRFPPKWGLPPERTAPILDYGRPLVRQRARSEIAESERRFNGEGGHASDSPSRAGRCR